MYQKLDSVKCYREKKAEAITRTVNPFGNEGAPSTTPRENGGDRCHPLHLRRGSRVAGKGHHGIGRQKASVKSLSQYLSNSQ